VLALDGLDGVHVAAPVPEAAFVLLRGARGVVLDLRRNGGGDPGTVTLVLDWLLGGERPTISDVIYRDRTRSGGRPGGSRTWRRRKRRRSACSSASAPSRRAKRSPTTCRAREERGSSGSARRRRRHVTPVRLSGHVRAFLPEALRPRRVTGNQLGGHGRRARHPLRAGRGRSRGDRGAGPRSGSQVCSSGAS
jgi:hypothetical protein